MDHRARFCSSTIAATSASSFRGARAVDDRHAPDDQTFERAETLAGFAGGCGRSPLRVQGSAGRQPRDDEHNRNDKGETEETSNHAANDN